MQFRKVGRKFFVYAYREYDAEKKRPVVRKVGTVDRYSKEFTPSDEWPPKPNEQKEIEEFISKRKDEEATSDATYALSTMLHMINGYIKKVDEHPDLLVNIDLPAVIKALDALKSRLKPLVKKSPKTTKKAAAKPKKQKLAKKPITKKKRK